MARLSFCVLHALPVTPPYLVSPCSLHVAAMNGLCKTCTYPYTRNESELFTDEAHPSRMEPGSCEACLKNPKSRFFIFFWFFFLKKNLSFRYYSM